jgi:hypothetical protein
MIEALLSAVAIWITNRKLAEELEDGGEERVEVDDNAILIVGNGDVLQAVIAGKQIADRKNATRIFQALDCLGLSLRPIGYNNPQPRGFLRLHRTIGMSAKEQEAFMPFWGWSQRRPA